MDCSICTALWGFHQTTLEFCDLLELLTISLQQLVLITQRSHNIMHFAFLAALVFAAGAVTATGNFVLDTPVGTKQCSPTVMLWTGGIGPFLLVLIAGGQPVQQFGDIPVGATIFTWPTNVAAGTAVTVTMRDAEGKIAQTAPFVIQDGPDDCNFI
ncbi:hypothetical protein GY45DRAFT_183715 [Cubamyces sp. BRFM 1775]|nr:hypothetical protein GY45DRAFT_183715 [Cubamyces sp. BRFM 1775]